MSKTATQATSKEARSVKLLRDIAGAASLRAGVIVPVKAEAPGMVCVETASGMPAWLALANECEFVPSHSLTEQLPVATATDLNGKKPTVKPHLARKFAEAAAKKKSTAEDAESAEKNSRRAPASASSAPSAVRFPDVVMIPLEKLHPHPKNRVIDFPSCDDLAQRLQAGGQLTPCIVRPAAAVDDELTAPPLGHYQILAGERRCRAAQIAGWDALACLVRDVGDAEALRILVEENAQREDLTDIEKAQAIEDLCLPVVEGGAGYTREQAGKIYNLSAGAASNLVRLLELPPVWRERVSKGELPQTFARELLPYAKHPQLIKAIEAEIAADVKEEGAVLCTRSDFGWMVQGALRDVTRSLERKDFDGPKFKLTAELEAELQPFTVPKHEHRDARKVALNVKLWDKLQAEANNAKADPHREKPGKAKAKATEKPKPLTAAELAKKAKEAAERTTKAIAAWRLLFLREILAQTLDYSRFASVTHLFDIWLVARPFAPSGHHTQILLSQAIKAAGGKVVSSADATKYMAAAAAIKPADRWQIKLELLRLVLRDDVELSADVIQPLALECEIEIEAWWRKWQTEGRSPRETQLITRFFELHTTDQLVALAAELDVGVMAGAKKSVLVQSLAFHHRRGRTLALPKSIAPLKAPRQSPKKGKAKAS